MYYQGQSHVMDPGALRNQQDEALRNERQGQNMGPGGVPQDWDYRQAQQQQYLGDERSKKLWTDFARMLHSGGVGGQHNVPAYNRHEQEGRGLVDPSMNQQETLLPLPFSRRYQQAANYAAVVNSLPDHIYQQNQSINTTVEKAHPLVRGALYHKGTIYEQVPKNFMVNRLNIALQRQREDSIYGYAGWA